MDKGGMLVPSTHGRMVHMLRGNDHCVPSAKTLVWRNKADIRMGKDGMLASSMRGRMVHMLR